jgi:hypothetical protein
MKSIPLRSTLGIVFFSIALPFLRAEDTPATTPTPASTPVASSVPAVVIAKQPRTLSLEVAVLRFKPAKAERILQGFKNLSGNLNSVVDSLKADGAVSVLYSGSRDIRLEEKCKAKFDALENRPVMIVGKPANGIPPVTAYGLALEISINSIGEDRFGLGWEGNVSWSPEVVDSWKGEKFMSFMTGAASIAKTASSLAGGTDNKTIDSGADIGLGFAKLFNPNGSQADNQIYELPVNKTVTLTCSRNCRSGELIINPTTAEMGSKEAQTILLLTWPTIAQ